MSYKNNCGFSLETERKLRIFYRNWKKKVFPNNFDKASKISFQSCLYPREKTLYKET